MKFCVKTNLFAAGAASLFAAAEKTGNSALVSQITSFNYCGYTARVLNGAGFFFIMEECSVFMLSVKKALKTKPDAFLVTSRIFWA